MLVEGRVKVRDDRVQLNCDHARPYQPEDFQETEPPPDVPSEEPVAKETTASPEPAESRLLIVTINQTCDEGSDIACLSKLINVLKDFPGEDEVSLRVNNGNKVFNLRLPHMTTSYCPELHQRLVELVGEEGVIIEPL